VGQLKLVALNFEIEEMFLPIGAARAFRSWPQQAGLSSTFRSRFIFHNKRLFGQSISHGFNRCGVQTFRTGCLAADTTQWRKER
jgi:hypothetical protein